MGKVGKAISKPFKSATKGLFGTVESIAKGDIKGAAKSWTSFATFGVADSLLDGLNEKPQVNEQPAVETLAAEAESTAKKRKSMYFTEGEELGQETTRVFNTQKRGSIFS